jgi:hypothetical protein
MLAQRLKKRLKTSPIVIPAQAGTQWLCSRLSREPTRIRFTAKIVNRSHWIPACAGMTDRNNGGYEMFTESLTTTNG